MDLCERRCQLAASRVIMPKEGMVHVRLSQFPTSHGKGSIVRKLLRDGTRDEGQHQGCGMCLV